MTEINKKMVLGMVVITILVSSGATIMIAEEDGWKNCVGGWELNADTGMYDCASRGVSEWCYRLSESRYRCYLGKPITPLNTGSKEGRESFTITYYADGEEMTCSLDEPKGEPESYRDDILQCIKERSPDKKITEIRTPYEISFGDA